MTLPRRQILRAAVSLLCAPAIVRAGSLMAVVPLRDANPGYTFRVIVQWPDGTEESFPLLRNENLEKQLRQARVTQTTWGQIFIGDETTPRRQTASMEALLR